MWQRAQTIYLALIVICLSLTLVFPFASYPTEAGELTLSIGGLTENAKEVTSLFPYYILIALTLALALFSITQFKDRKRQLALGKINYILIIATVALLFWDTSSIATALNVAEEDISYGISMFLPVVALPLTFLANRGIKSDEKLIKSVDRLR